MTKAQSEKKKKNKETSFNIENCKIVQLVNCLADSHN